MKVTNVMIVGVGGQGTLLASRIIGYVCLKLGLDVKMSEVHGMAQRGGSVVTYVKFGEKVFSPIIEKKSADYILAFEKLEAKRWIDYISKDGILILNDQQIDPMPVIVGSTTYPEGLLEELSSKYNVKSLDALSLAMEVGNRKSVNVVMIGKLAKILDFDKEIWIEALKNTIKPKFIDVNLKAFELGYNS